MDSLAEIVTEVDKEGTDAIRISLQKIKELLDEAEHLTLSKKTKVGFKITAASNLKDFIFAVTIIPYYAYRNENVFVFQKCLHVYK